MKRQHWIIVVLSIWLLVSPWILGFSALNLVVWNNVAISFLIIILIFWDFSPPLS
ncbi:MAG: SPW repeat protein [Patescibacteria group bacterium]|nr:SPW repeat protein [Patescibacteria group bacterium]